MKKLQATLSAILITMLIVGGSVMALTPTLEEKLGGEIETLIQEQEDIHGRANSVRIRIQAKQKELEELQSKLITHKGEWNEKQGKINLIKELLAEKKTLD